MKTLVRLLLLATTITAMLFSLIRGRASDNYASKASDVISLVNQLRAANGLPPYQVNQALMVAAQSHSDFQAANDTISHSGAGGSAPRDRAIAAGYGGGGAVFVTENIMGGGGVSPASAVQAWQGDALHLNTMLGSNYMDAGAGYAEANGSVYITLDVGYVAGSTGSGQTNGGNKGSNQNPTLVFPLPGNAIPLEQSTSTPASDGSVTHVVQSGQTLWTLAAIYNVPLEELVQENNLSENSVIYPGDKIIIKPGLKITATPTQPAETPEPTPTSMLKHTSEEDQLNGKTTVKVRIANSRLSESEGSTIPAQTMLGSSISRKTPLLGVVIIAVIAGILVVVISVRKN